MKILIEGASSIIRKLRLEGDPRIGEFTSPARRGLPVGSVFAADNGAFSFFDPVAFGKLLDRLERHPIKPIFVVSPDVFGDAAATFKLFQEWEPKIRSRGLPVALVLQAGQDKVPILWDRIDAIFVGGPDFHRRKPYVAEYCRKAKALGKWIHVGRVNSARRLDWAIDLGADSVDGSGISRFPSDKLPRMLRAIDRAAGRRAQGVLDFAAGNKKERIAE
jgi:hypothetical protein